MHQDKQKSDRETQCKRKSVVQMAEAFALKCFKITFAPA